MLRANEALRDLLKSSEYGAGSGTGVTQQPFSMLVAQNSAKEGSSSKDLCTSIEEEESQVKQLMDEMRKEEDWQETD